MGGLQCMHALLHAKLAGNSTAGNACDLSTHKCVLAIMGPWNK
jgi:hypothetical protein